MKFQITRTPWQAALLAAATLSVWAATPAMASVAANTPQELPRELGKPEEEDLSIHIRHFEVDGLPNASKTDIQRVTAPYVGHNKGFEDLMNAAAAVTRYMQTELGYYVGFAYVPTQSGKDGVIRLQALEGRLDSIDVNVADGPHSERHREMIRAQLSGIKPGDVLYTQSVERTTLLLNDLPGLETNVEVTEGTTPGSVKLQVTGKALPPHNFRVSLDTYGSRETGVYRIGAGVNSTGVLTAGDSVNLDVMASYTGEFNQATLGYSVPVGATGLKVGAVASHVNLRIQRPDWAGDVGLGQKNTVDVAGAYALYPLVRSRDFNAFVVSSYEHKRFKEKHLDYYFTDTFLKTSNDWIVGLVGDARDDAFGGGITTYDAQLVWGKLDDHLPDYYYRTTNRSFHKLAWNVGRLQNLIPNRFQLYVKAQGQMSNSQLDNSEHYVAGGPTGVRAFESGSVSGDQGYLMSTELRWLPSAALFGEHARELMFSVFYDWAKVKVGDDAPGDFDADWNWVVRKNYVVSGYGVGVTWEKAPDFSLHANIAWRNQQSHIHVNSSNHPRFNLALSKRF